MVEISQNFVVFSEKLNFKAEEFSVVRAKRTNQLVGGNYTGVVVQSLLQQAIRYRHGIG